MDVIKVSSVTGAGELANVIFKSMSREGKVQLRAISAAAINQAVKAIAISRINFVPYGADVICAPWFSDVYIDHKLKTAITFCVELRWPDEAASAA